MNPKKENKILIDTLKSMVFPISFVIAMWVIYFWQTHVGFSYNIHGIIPRKLFGLKGILMAPLLHGSIGHLVSNTVPFLALTTIIFVLYKRVAYGSFFIIYILTGFLVWIFGKDANHIGASGIVYGFVAFIFWSGIFRKNKKAIVLSLIVLVVYSSYFLGIVPGKEGISWESHLLGGVAGIITAFLFRSLIEDDEKSINPWVNQAISEKEYMFRRDLFDMTLEERRSQRAYMTPEPESQPDPFDIIVEFDEL